MNMNQKLKAKYQLAKEIRENILKCNNALMYVNWRVTCRDYIDLNFWNMQTRDSYTYTV